MKLPWLCNTKYEEKKELFSFSNWHAPQLRKSLSQLIFKCRSCLSQSTTDHIVTDILIRLNVNTTAASEKKENAQCYNNPFVSGKIQHVESYLLFFVFFRFAVASHLDSSSIPHENTLQPHDVGTCEQTNKRNAQEKTKTKIDETK